MDIVALHNPKIYQIDIKNAFLNENLDEEINMKQPKRFKVTRHERKLCKLVKSSYGLKQASKLWHEKFNNIMLSNDLNINECYKCVYVKNTYKTYVIVCLYVDNILIFDNNTNIIKTFNQMLTSKFNIKDTGVAYVILEMRILFLKHMMA